MKNKYLGIAALICVCLATGCAAENETGKNTSEPSKTQEQDLTNDTTQSENEEPADKQSEDKQSEGGQSESSPSENTLPEDTKKDTDTGNNTGNNTSNNTNNTISESSDSTKQSAASQPGATAEDFYNVCTSHSAIEVENFASEVRSLILAKDWNGLSEKIEYPLTVGETTCADSAAFLALDLDANVSQDFLDGIEAETCHEMFCNFQGIMMGESGQVWINETAGTGELKVTALNGLLK